MATSRAINVACDGDWSTLTEESIRKNWSIEDLITQYQRWFYPTPIHSLVDPVDLYMWDALADSERQMIALIEARRAPGNMGHTGGMAVTA